MKPRIPLAYAGLLVIALVAVVGFAAFSPSATSDPTDDTNASVATSEPVVASARVASAVLALRVSEAQARTATTEATTEASVVPESTTSPSTTNDTESSTSSSSSSSTSAPPASTTTKAPPSTNAAAPPADTTPPAIKVTSPSDGATVTDRLVTFKGTAEPGAKVSSGPYDADVAEDGTWSIRLIVISGANGALFTATDDAGNSSSARIVVNYDPPVTTTTQAPSPTTTQGSTPTTTAPAGPKWSPNWPASPAGNRDVENWRSLVAQYFSAERVDCVLGIIKRESHGNPQAYNSSSSAEGLMQHLSKYWHSRAKSAGFVDGDGLVATPYNAEANIAAGASLANYYHAATGDWWSPWKSSDGTFTAFYGSCQSPDPS